jgi:hypothetical protein
MKNKRFPFIDGSTDNGIRAQHCLKALSLKEFLTNLFLRRGSVARGHG